MHSNEIWVVHDYLSNHFDLVEAMAGYDPFSPWILRQDSEGRTYDLAISVRRKK